MEKGLIFLVLVFFLQTALVGQIPLARQKVVVTNERRINSQELEFSPAFYKDGIVFVSTRFESLMYNVKDSRAGGQNIMSIYQARRDAEGFLNSPEPLALELIFRMHEGPVAFDKTAENIYFTGNESQHIAPDGFKKLQIFTSRKDSLGWGNIDKPSFNLVDYNFCHPSLSVDGDVLYVSSDMPGGFGGMDIYAIYFEKGKWVEIKNLGAEVNSPDNEVFPFSAADGTLYFSSDRDGGLGKLDIYYTKEWGQEWRRPVNLGTPFNSEYDDLGFIVDNENKNGYFSSDRIGGFGYDDIYSFHIEGSASSIAGSGMRLDGLVVKDENGIPIDKATISAVHMDEVTLSAGSERGVRLIPGEDGNFVLSSSNDILIFASTTQVNGQVDAELNPGNYILKIAKEGFLPQYLLVNPETDFYAQDIRLKKAVDCVALKGKVLMRIGGRPVSGATLEIVDVNTREKILVYTDDTGSFEYCLKCNSTYALFTHKNGIASSITIVNTREKRCDSTAVIDLPIFLSGDNIYAGMTITLPNIYFNFDDASLRPDAYPDLDEVVAMLNSYPNMKLELASHTDSRGSHAYNNDLSLRRSESVFKYIVSKGIEVSRLTKRGYGETQIRNRCKDGVTCSEEEHRYNRRTEVKIIFLGDEKRGQEIGARTLEDVRNEMARSKFMIPLVSEKGGQETEVFNNPLKLNNTESSEELAESKFMVIAGTFSNKDNAFRRINQLISLGYDTSEIIARGNSGLFAILVNVFSKEKDAKDLVKELARLKVEAYVLNN